MKAAINAEGKLELDVGELVAGMSDADKRVVAKFACFDEVLIKGILEALVDGHMWSDETDGPWWHGGETYTKLRMQLLPLLPAITAEAVRHLEAEMRAARKERDAYRDACWRLQREWRQGDSGSFESVYEYRRPMSKEDAEAYLRGVEAEVEAGRG
jgi:hypothetical protein